MKDYVLNTYRYKNIIFLSENLPRHFGRGYLHLPSIWHTVDVLPSRSMPSWQRKIIDAPRPVPASIFSSHPFQRRPGCPQLISGYMNKNTIYKSFNKFFVMIIPNCPSIFFRTGRRYTKFVCMAIITLLEMDNEEVIASRKGMINVRIFTIYCKQFEISLHFLGTD